MNRGALAGIEVIELGTAIAGPFCGALLGDMGADVIKVEAPGRGDDSRNWGTKVNGESPYFVHYNRNKRSIALDIRRPEGRDVLLRLVKRSDVFIENFRPGTMNRLRLSYQTLRRVNPRIVYCSVSGFGQTGPYREKGGYDAMIQAMSGIMSLTGEEDGPPLRVGSPVTDITAALQAAFAIAIALFVRERTKKGQFIDTSLLEAGVSIVGQWLMISTLTGQPVRRFGNKYPLLAPYELFETEDRPVVIAVGNDDQWKRLCAIMGSAELASDPRFRTNPDRIRPENRAVLTRLVQDKLRQRPAGHWLRELEKAGIPVGMINKVEDLPDDPQLLNRKVFQMVKHPSLGRIKVVKTTARMSATPGSIRLPSPRLGEHTRVVLRELGLSARQISALREKGVIQA